MPRQSRPGPEQDGEVVEGLRRIGMVRAERLLAYRQRALVERLCPRKITLGSSRRARLLRLAAV